MISLPLLYQTRPDINKFTVYGTSNRPLKDYLESKKPTTFWRLIENSSTYSDFLYWNNLWNSSFHRNDIFPFGKCEGFYNFYCNLWIPYPVPSLIPFSLKKFFIPS